MKPETLKVYEGREVEAIVMLPGSPPASFHGMLQVAEAEGCWRVAAERRVEREPLGGSPDGRFIVKAMVIPEKEYTFEADDIKVLSVRMESVSEAEEHLGVKDGSRHLEAMAENMSNLARPPGR